MSLKRTKLVVKKRQIILLNTRASSAAHTNFFAVLTSSFVMATESRLRSNPWAPTQLKTGAVTRKITTF